MKEISCQFAIILFVFYLFLFLPQMVKCLILKTHSEKKVPKEDWRFFH